MSNEVKTKEKVDMDPKYIVKLTVTLFATCVVVAGLLGLVNIGAVKVDYARYYAFIIHLFVELDIMGVEKLINYVSKVGRESFSDLGAGIF